MTLHARLRYARTQKRISQKSLAQAVGMTQSAISQLETGETKTLEGENLLNIAAFLDVAPAWLMHGKATQSPISPASKTTINDTVPLISWVQAGEWCEAIDNYQPGDAEEWLRCTSPHGSHTYALRVRGVSMEPEFKEGEIIIVDPESQPENNAYVIVRLLDSNEVTFKQLIIEGNRKILRALNPAWPGGMIELDDNAVLCGRVIEKHVRY